MTRVTLSSACRFTIPRDIREKLRITPGQQFVVTESGRSIILTPVHDDPIEFLCGCMKDGPSMTEELLRERARDLEHE